MDWLGLCNAIVFANTTYPRPDVQVGIAVSISAYDEAHMRQVLARVLADFVANGLNPFYQFSKSGDLPWTFPGSDLQLHDFRREYMCDGYYGCNLNKRIMEAFSMGYRLDSLGPSDVDAVRWYVHNETGGRLNRTLSDMCTEFDKTCMTTGLSTLPPVTSAPAEPNMTGGYVLLGFGIAAAVGVAATTVYVLAHKLCPTRGQLAETEAELQELQP